MSKHFYLFGLSLLAVFHLECIILAQSHKGHCPYPFRLIQVKDPTPQQTLPQHNNIARELGSTKRLSAIYFNEIFSSPSERAF